MLKIYCMQNQGTFENVSMTGVKNLLLFELLICKTKDFTTMGFLTLLN